jgi:two-component system sensor histidine kinase YesM
MLVFNSLRGRYLNTSIRNKMILINSFIIFFVAFIIGSASVLLYTQTISNELAVINLRDVKQIGNSIDYIQKDAEELSSFICSDSILQRTICYSPEELDRHLSDENYVKYLLNNLMVSKSYSFVSLYAGNGFSYYAAADMSTDIPGFKELEATQAYAEADEKRGAPLWAYLPRGDAGYIRSNKNAKIAMFRSVLKLNDYSAKGTLMLALNLSTIKPIYAGTLDTRGSTMLLLDGANTPFFIDPQPKDGSFVGSILAQVPAAVWSRREGSEIYRWKGQSYLVTFTSLRNVDWKVLNVVPLGSFTTNTSFVPVVALIASILALVLGFYFTTYTSLQLTKPIKNLLQSMSRVKDGNFREYVGFKYRDEIGQLGAEYDQMISRVNELIHEVYVLGIEEKIAELKALQAQINPHFLYNTLDTIYWKAVAGDNKDVQDMIHALSQVFRLVLNVGNEFLQVSQEKDFISYYILLQGQRYKNRLRYAVDFDADIMGRHIPKLILQPFVENTIVHGLETNDKQITISIRGVDEDGQIHFIIRDDGPGMPEEVLRKIIDPSQNDASPEKGGYGIKNVINRLSLYYGDKYRLEVESRVGEGTTIHIWLPVTPTLTLGKE